jgi:hypothetical protein
MRKIDVKRLLLFALLVMAQHTFSIEWKGQWINTERCQSAKNTWLIYRKTIDMTTVPQSLKARIAVDSKYWLWINNQPVVFEGGLKRGPSPHGAYYDVVDIAPYLTPGENLIAVLVWHFGQDGFSHSNSGKAALLFDAAASGIEIVSDASWQCGVYEAYQNTEAPFPNFRLPESNIRFDARREVKDWNLTTFKGSLPQAVSIAKAGDAPFGQLTERPIPQWKDYGLTAYPEIRQSGDTLICKLPYNCQVTPWLRVEAKPGATIHMQTDNYRGGGDNNVRAEYITREGVQEYESYGWMNGHEVWYIIPEGVKVLEARYRETGYNAEFTGSFQCNDPFYNELWKRSARTLYITMRDTYMDCPDRERAQWWGDEVNELGETFYALSPAGQQLATKGIYELMNWQREDGVVYAPVPAGNWNKELPLQMLASVGWYGFYTQYFYSADSAFVPVVYDRLYRYLHDVWKVDKSGLAIERPGGWTWGDWGENIDMGVLTNCWYYLALKAQKAFAGQLGKQEDVAFITQKMETIANCFDTRFWNGTAYRSPGYKGETDDRAQAMAVVSGLASKDKYPAIVNVLRKEYHASPYMETYVLEALFQMNQPEFALQRMKERYAGMISYPYTTLFEEWNSGTINHAWSGGPLTMLSRKVCGIEPSSPGFKTFKVAPQMGNLTEAEAVVDTHFGKITVEIKKSGSRLRIQLTVPEGTSAEVISPKGKRQNVAAGTHSFVL